MSDLLQSTSVQHSLRILKTAKNLKNSDLAAAMNMTENSVSRFLNDGCSMPLDKVEKLVKALGGRLVVVVDPTPEGT